MGSLPSGSDAREEPAAETSERWVCLRALWRSMIWRRRWRPKKTQKEAAKKAQLDSAQHAQSLQARRAGRSSNLAGSSTASVIASSTKARRRENPRSLPKQRKRSARQQKAQKGWGHEPPRLSCGRIFFYILLTEYSHSYHDNDLENCDNDDNDNKDYLCF